MVVEGLLVPRNNFADFVHSNALVDLEIVLHGVIVGLVGGISSGKDLIGVFSLANQAWIHLWPNALLNQRKVCLENLESSAFRENSI